MGRVIDAHQLCIFTTTSIFHQETFLKVKRISERFWLPLNLCDGTGRSRFSLLCNTNMCLWRWLGILRLYEYEGTLLCWIMGDRGIGARDLGCQGPVTLEAQEALGFGTLHGDPQ